MAADRPAQGASARVACLWTPRTTRQETVYGPAACVQSGVLLNPHKNAAKNRTPKRSWPGPFLCKINSSTRNFPVGCAASDGFGVLFFSHINAAKNRTPIPKQLIRFWCAIFFAVKMHRKIAHQNGTEDQKSGFVTGKFPVGVELGRRLVALFWRAGRQRCWTST